MAIFTGSRGQRSSSQIISKISSTLLVLILVLEGSAFASARFSFLDGLLSAPRSGIADSQEAASLFTVDLMHSLHLDSPYAQQDLTFSETVELLLEGSRARWKYLNHQISVKRDGSFGTPHGFASPLYSVQGTYIMQVTLGTPARTFRAVADTGSDLTWLQCSPCTRCYQQPDPLFEPRKSFSYEPVPCTAQLCEDLLVEAKYSCSSEGTCVYKYTYGDSSATSGALAYENFTFTSTDESQMVFPEIAFGCATDNGGTFRDADGLVGLGRGPLSLLSQLGPNFASIFSYCLVGYESAMNVTSPLLLGSAWPTALTYTPLIQNSVMKTYYYVNLTGITVAGEAVDYPPGTFDISINGTGGIILDSGSTASVLVEDAFTPFLEAVSALISYPNHNGSIYDLDLCYNISRVQNPVFPHVVFNFEDLDVALPVDNLFMRMDDASIVCLAFVSSPPGSISIFGNIQQQNFQISYDLNKNKVGFAPAKC